MEERIDLTGKPPLAAVSGSLLLGGSTTFLLNLAAALRRRGHNLPVLALSERVEHRDDFAAAALTVEQVSWRDHIFEDRLLRAYQALARSQPQAVLACLSSESFEVLRLLPPGVVRLGIIQSDDPGPYQLPRLYAPWLDAMIGVSARICENMREFPECGKMEIAHIPYGIEHAPVPERRQCAPQAPLRLVYVGRLIEEQKRVSRLIELARSLAAERMPAHLTVVGSGPDEAAFRRAAANCTNVTVRGAVANRDIPSILCEQDVFVLLSDYEGLPLSLLEAMGQGLVPVVSDLPSGLREVVTDECGIRVPVGDMGAAVRAIASLAANRTRLERLADHARRLARKHYSADRMAEQYLNLVARLAPAGPQAPAWPAHVPVSIPKLVSPSWLYQGWPRRARRWLKRLRRHLPA